MLKRNGESGVGIEQTKKRNKKKTLFPLKIHSINFADINYWHTVNVLGQDLGGILMESRPEQRVIKHLGNFCLDRHTLLTDCLRTPTLIGTPVYILLPPLYSKIYY